MPIMPIMPAMPQSGQNPLMRQRGGMPMQPIGAAPFGNQQIQQGQPQFRPGMPMPPAPMPLGKSFQQPGMGTPQGVQPMPMMQPPVTPQPMTQPTMQKSPMSSQQSSQMIQALMRSPPGTNRQGQM